MERATVNVATGALGPVLQKLTALLVQDQYRSRLGAGTRSDIEFIKSELASLHSLLLRIWEREDLDTECKNWMVDAREMSYDMEDDIDDFMLGSEPSDGGGGRGHSSIESLIHRFKSSVMDVSRRCLEEWKTAAAAAEAISIPIKRSVVDPRAGFLHRDASDLVGMDEPNKELLKLLQEHKMVCIQGFAGMGKTTLADLVYHKIGHEFQCRAFVSLSKSPDMLEVLRAVLSQVTDGVQSSGSRCTQEATEENLSNQISNFLTDKRYLVIVDDIWHWEEWEIIRRALPEGVPRCRILATTRANAIAEKCRLTKFNNGGACIYRYGGIKSGDAATLAKTVFKNKLQSIHQIRFSAEFIKDVLVNIIPSMCHGMPLAVECLTSEVTTNLAIHDIMAHYSSGENGSGLQKLLWQVLVDGLGSSINHPSLKPLAESLRLGYDDLPLYLKTCLLYCSMYPTGYHIERHRLVRKWMAEGFVYHQAEEGEEAAEGCLDELVSRGLLQQESSQGNKQYYSVQPVLRAFLVCKSEQANFAAYLDEFADNSRPSILQSAGPILHCAGRIRSAALRGGLRTRSLMVLSYSPADRVRDPLLKNVRVLSIEPSIESRRFLLTNSELAEICNRQLRLRYLGLNNVGVISALPRQIGKLQRLETLDISYTSIGRLPMEIGNLQHLKILDVSHSGVSELPREIGNLQRLEALDVSHTSVRELPLLLSNSVIVFAGNKHSDKGMKLSDDVLAVMRHLKEVVISSSLARPGPGEDLRIILYDHLYQLLPVAGLKIVGRHMRLPGWFKQHLASVSALDIRLCKLDDDDHSFLHNKMPNLQHLTLKLEVLPRKAIAITGEGFSMLKSFCLDCRLPLVTFQQGAMQKLEHLEFKFYTSRAFTSEDPVGIRYLPSLQRVVFQSSPRYKSDALGISVVINKVREEAKEHPNKITVSVNGEYIDTAVSSGTSLEDRIIIEKRERALKAALTRAAAAAAGRGKLEIRKAQE